MKRSLYVAALITALAACGPRAGAGSQAGSGVPSALDEAARLDAMIETLYVIVSRAVTLSSGVAESVRIELPTKPVILDAPVKPPAAVPDAPPQPFIQRGAGVPVLSGQLMRQGAELAAVRAATQSAALDDGVPPTLQPLDRVQPPQVAVPPIEQFTSLEFNDLLGQRVFVRVVVV